MPLADRPLLGHVLQRARRARALDEVVMATTTLPLDDPLVPLAREYGASVFRGHPTDLVDRYYHAALVHGADVVVRIPADNPLIHPREIDRIVEYYLTHDVDFASNITSFLGNEYPDGLGAEVFSMVRMKELFDTVTNPRDREHVTTYFRENPQSFRCGTVPCPPEFRRPDVVLDVNTPEDYAFISRLFAALQRPNALIDITEIIPWYDLQPRRK